MEGFWPDVLRLPPGEHTLLDCKHDYFSEILLLFFLMSYFYDAFFFLDVLRLPPGEHTLLDCEHDYFSKLLLLLFK